LLIFIGYTKLLSSLQINDGFLFISKFHVQETPFDCPIYVVWVKFDSFILIRKVVFQLVVLTVENIDSNTLKMQPPSLRGAGWAVAIGIICNLEILSIMTSLRIRPCGAIGR
jgi:hypothetical protein